MPARPTGSEGDVSSFLDDIYDTFAKGGEYLGTAITGALERFNLDGSKLADFFKPEAEVFVAGQKYESRATVEGNPDTQTESKSNVVQTNFRDLFPNGDALPAALSITRVENLGQGTVYLASNDFTPGAAIPTAGRSEPTAGKSPVGGTGSFA